MREGIPEAQSLEGASLKHDISVSTSRLPEFIDEGARLAGGIVPGARLVAYGHLGDGNLHFNLSAPLQGDAAQFLQKGPELRRAMHDLVASYRGSFSAEHGIGRSKITELARYEDPVALALMHTIKQALDPRGLMNPGKVLPQREPD